MDEKTQVFDDNTNKGKSSSQESKKENKNTGMKTAGAVAGGVVLGNLAWGLAKEAKETVDEYIVETANEEVVAEEAVIDENESIPEGGIEPADVSSVVTDDMSFNDAFAAAREELGAGGVFEWNGNTYGTYYKEEWDNLSPEETEEYWASVEAAEVDIEQEVLPEEMYTESIDLDEDGYAESILADTDGNGQVDMIISDLDANGKVDYVGADTDGDGIIDTEAFPDNEGGLANNTSYEAEAVDSSIASEGADLDGDGYEESVLIDSNNDGLVDIVASDTNMDGNLDSAVADTDFDGVADLAVADTTGDGEFDRSESLEEDYLAENPEDDSYGNDFDNDADMSDWA